MAACVDRALWRLYPTVDTTPLREKLPVVLQGLELLWQSSELPEVPDDKRVLCSQVHDQLENIAAEDADAQEIVDGWWDLLVALITALGFVLHPEQPIDGLSVAGLAYQVMWFQRVHSRPFVPSTDRVWKDATVYLMDWERFVRETELNDSVCMEDLSFQLQCLARLEAGLDVERSTPGLRKQ
jgi:hypothetical protein